MKARYIILIIVISLIAVEGVFVYQRARVSFHSDENATTVFDTVKTKT